MNQKEIEPYLQTASFGRWMHCFETIDSTNTFAKSLLLQEVREGTLVIADEQTSGKGRLGRSWQSEKGKNLMFSIILQPNIPIEQLGIMSLYAGAAVAEALQNYLNDNVSCKWPNDILIKGKKVCGILSESVIESNGGCTVIIGIGINVNQSVFPDDLQATASSLCLFNNKSHDRFEVLSKVLGQLEQLYQYIQNGDIRYVLNLWEQHSAIMGRRIIIQQQAKTLSGTATGISNDGALLLQTGNNEMKIYAGDVTLINQSMSV